MNYEKLYLEDQIYQYGEAGDARIGSLKGETFEEDITSLEDVFLRRVIW